ncbi:MAG: membrane-bound lytic murein transglycosylase MltF [Ectothiorhodospiraceae bacterium]|nr:membrane-bound lytic murein transglycosylase MltF [Ectothiorhodospiraceae bacterium]
MRVVTLAQTGERNRLSGSTSLDHELVITFAESLGVNVTFLVVNSKTEVFRALASGDAHLATAGISSTERRKRQFRCTRPYLKVDRQLIYRVGNPAPDSMQSLVSGDYGRLEVLAQSHHAARLRELQRSELGELTWDEIPTGNPEDLLFRVWNHEVELAIADSIDVELTQRYYPELRVAFTLDKNLGLVWAVANSDDTSLYDAADRFIHEATSNGVMAQLEEKYRGHLGQFDYVASRVFLRHVTKRLPDYREMFQQAAAENGVDWRLLAAIGYQESHWNPRAVSPTGVRGVMMLTQRTAGELGVTDRRDPEQSIFGGAKYFRALHDRLPDHLNEPVRTWFALAAYNVGMGHLEDARRLTESRGGNRDSWADVKDTLPLLAKPEWHEQTRFGYARGWEPVIYVGQVRTYYELLVRITEGEEDLPPADPLPWRSIPYQEVRRDWRLGNQLESAL